MPDDLTLRARTILARASIVVAETPLAARIGLSRDQGNGHGIRTRRRRKIAILLDRLAAGHDIALVSDGGMPVIYDQPAVDLCRAGAGSRDGDSRAVGLDRCRGAFGQAPTGCCSLADCLSPLSGLTGFSGTPSRSRNHRDVCAVLRASAYSRAHAPDPCLTASSHWP
jgi:hypothetical protein